MAALLGLVTGVLAFIPNIGAITSGVLMVAVGFSAGPHQGVLRDLRLLLRAEIDGYFVVPYIARRTVDLAPAVVLAMQLLMGALFGILGVLFADPILATMKVALVDLSRRQAAKEGERPQTVVTLASSCAVAAAARRCIIAAPPRHDLPHLDLEGEIAVARPARRRTRSPNGRRGGMVKR